MPLPNKYTDRAREKANEINHNFQERIQNNPADALNAVADRSARINREIIEPFKRDRSNSLGNREEERTLDLEARAGRGHAKVNWEGIHTKITSTCPRESKEGVVRGPSHDWYVSRTWVHEKNNIAGSYEHHNTENNTAVFFKVNAKGVTAECLDRGHGAEHAEIHAYFKMKGDVINNQVNAETEELRTNCGL